MIRSAAFCRSATYDEGEDAQHYLMHFKEMWMRKAEGKDVVRVRAALGYLIIRFFAHRSRYE